MTDIGASLLLIQNPSSVNETLSSQLDSLSVNFCCTEDITTAIYLLDTIGFKPSVIVVDIASITEKQVTMLEGIESSLNIHEWIYVTYALEESVALRLQEMAYRNIDQQCSIDCIETVVKNAVRSTLVRRRIQEYTEHKVEKNSIASIVGSSCRIQNHKKMMLRLSEIPLRTLMIKGETGSGKGHTAKVLHTIGPRKKYSFVEMNCAAMPSELVESQLFGHERGAFSGANTRHHGLLEQANRGTLFLDEIGEMPVGVQAKLLKAIEEQRYRRVGGEIEIKVDVQVFAASNRNIQAMVVAGSFREDLYHRLNVFEIVVPALREYKSDLVELVPIIMAEYNLLSGQNVSIITDKAWQTMLDYNWPGNVRELRNAIERSVLLAKGHSLSSQWLNLNNTLLASKLVKPQDNNDEHIKKDDSVKFKNTLFQTAGIQANQIFFTLDGLVSLDEIHRQIILKALKISNQNISKAAKLLGSTRETLRYRVQKYGLI